MAKNLDIKPVLVIGGEMPKGETVGNLDGDCEGKIIKVEGLVRREFIEKAKALGSIGVIATGINYRDYRDLVRGGDEFPVAILKGFGETSDV